MICRSRAITVLAILLAALGSACGGRSEVVDEGDAGCPASATQQSNMAAFSAVTCSGLVPKGAQLVATQSSQDSSMAPSGLDDDWWFFYYDAELRSVYHVQVARGKVVVETVPGTLTCDAALELIDSTKMVPDAVARLALPGARPLHLEQFLGCWDVASSDFGDQRYVFEFTDSANGLFAVYSATGAFVRTCGPCQAGGDLANCAGCKP